MRQIAFRLGCDPVTVRKKLFELGLAPRSYSEANRLYPRRDFAGDYCTRAYLIGFRLGDLHITTFGSADSTVVVNCSTTKQEQLDLIAGLFAPYGHVHIGRAGLKGCRNITVYLNNTFSFLVPKEDAVPPWVQDSASCSISFAAGYIDAEGSFFLTGAEARFAISSYDRNIIHWLYDWLNRVDVQCRPPYLAGRTGAMRPNGSMYKKDVWTVTVNRKRSLLKVTVLLEPHLRHAKRSSDLQRVKANVEARTRT
jgi:hypothetical protein